MYRAAFVCHTMSATRAHHLQKPAGESAVGACPPIACLSSRSFFTPARTGVTARTRANRQEWRIHAAIAEKKQREGRGVRTGIGPRVVLLLHLVRQVRVLEAQVGRPLEPLVAHVQVVLVHSPQRSVHIRRHHDHILVPQAV